MGREDKNSIEYKKFLIQKKESYHRHKKEIAKRRKENRDKIKFQVFEKYGNKCTCCGERELVFLSINHISKNGCKHRKNNPNMNGYYLYNWLQKKNYPKDFNILCHNCNFADGLGVCPHKL